jgi:hypothetical protein
MKDCTLGKLDEALQFAETIKDNSLQECINHIKMVDEIHGYQTKIFTDGAPKSFYFERFSGETFCGNGGIIFHGKHDNGGDGGAPTFSVSITPCNGWQIHT